MADSENIDDMEVDGEGTFVEPYVIFSKHDPLAAILRAAVQNAEEGQEYIYFLAIRDYHVDNVYQRYGFPCQIGTIQHTDEEQVGIIQPLDVEVTDEYAANEGIIIPSEAAKKILVAHIITEYTTGTPSSKTHLTLEEVSDPADFVDQFETDDDTDYEEPDLLEIIKGLEGEISDEDFEAGYGSMEG